MATATATVTENPADPSSHQILATGQSVQESPAQAPPPYPPVSETSRPQEPAPHSSSLDPDTSIEPVNETDRQAEHTVTSDEKHTYTGVEETATTEPPKAVDGVTVVGQPQRFAQPGLEDKVAVSLNRVGEVPACIDCPVCQYHAMTRIEKHSGHHANMAACITCLCAGILFAWIPYVLPSCKDTEHFCTNCNTRVVTVFKSGGVEVVDLTKLHRPAHTGQAVKGTAGTSATTNTAAAATAAAGSGTTGTGVSGK